MGMNHKQYNSLKMLRNATCTTTCLTHLVSVTVEGLMTIVHTITASQKIMMGPRGNCPGIDEELPRTSSLLPLALPRLWGKISPELNGKFSGMAFHVSIPVCLM